MQLENQRFAIMNIDGQRKALDKEIQTAGGVARDD